MQLSALQLVAGDQAKSAAQRAAEADGLRQRVAELEAATGDSAKEAADKIAKAEAAAAAQAKAVEDLRAQLSGLQLAAGNEAKSAADRLAAAADEARTREAAVADLHGEADGLKREIAHLNELLAAAETKVDTQQEKIDGLDAELGQALARKVEELEQYRSEFFGRLRKALGDRPDLRVVGDRFVFQSELLFASGSATPRSRRPGRAAPARADAGGGGGADPARRRLGPARRRPHRPAADPRRQRSARTGSCRRRGRSR